MINVLNILFEERIGGPQLYVLQVAHALAGKGFDSIVVVPKGDPEFVSLLRHRGIPSHSLDLVRLRRSFNPAEHVQFLVKFWPNVRQLRQLIRQHHIAIVHTHGLMNLQAAAAAILEGVPLVWHIHEILKPVLFRAVFVPPIRLCASAVAVVSNAVLRNYFQKDSPLHERLHVTYAPVDCGRFGPQVDGGKVREEFSIAAGCPVVGIVANLCPGKGQEFFLEAALLIRRRCRHAKFIVVGGKLDNRRDFWFALMQQTANLGLGRDVFFLGRRSDIPEVLRAMTVFVQASESEACPMALLEASASGLPVVATNVGGTPELVEDGVTGFLIEPKNPARIAEAVLRLLDSPEAARRMGQAGAERMRRHFSLDACVDAHVRMYNAVLSRAGAAVLADSQPAAMEGAEDVYSRN